MSRKHSGKLPPFIALFRHTVKSAEAPIEKQK